MTAMIEMEIPGVTENRKLLSFLRKAPHSGRAVGWPELLEGGASSSFRGPLT